MSDKVYDMVTEQITGLLAQGTIPWRKPWTGTDGRPRNAISGRAYRGVNVILLGAQARGPWWLTWNQIKQAGGRVRKGEKGSMVVFWRMLRVERDADGERTIDDFPMLRFYRVWNLEQTDGVTLPAKIRDRIDTGHVEAPEPIDAAEAICTGYPAGPEVFHGTDGAHYNPATDIIHLPAREAFTSPEGYYAARFHEMAHSTGHPSRLNRTTLTSTAGFGSHTYGREELVAEMTAAFLCAEAGIAPATVDNSAAYIASWLRTIREDPRAVVVAAGAAQRAADHILGRSADDGEKGDR